MLEKLTRALTDEKSRDLALVAGGMIGIMTGAKATPIAMFAVGARGLERRWRREHPDFDGDLRERWQRAIEFYDATHQDPTNRVLHTVGIPMIAGGLLGMLAAPASLEAARSDREHREGRGLGAGHDADHPAGDQREIAALLVGQGTRELLEHGNPPVERP